MACFNGIDLSQTTLAGVPNVTLQLWLLNAQSAMNDLMIGGKPVEVTYTQGDGSRSVTYTRASIPGLTMWIKQLQVQLGISRGRRPIRPVFGGR